MIILLMYTQHFSVKWSLTEEWVTVLTFVSSIPQSLRSCFLQCWTLHWLPPNHQPRMWDHPACKTITAVQQQLSVGEKSPSNQFDVTMGSFDGAETCELFGFYRLSLLKKKYGQNIGLYQDDGLAAFNMKPCEMEKSKKRFDFTHPEKWSKWIESMKWRNTSQHTSLPNGREKWGYHDNIQPNCRECKEIQPS